MVISGYVNYGVPGHEEENVFTISTPHLEASSHEEIIITLLKGMWESVTDDGKLKVGWAEGEFLADDIISTDGNDPIFRININGSRRTEKLEWKTGSI